MRLLLTGGGTAGHVYPALSVAEELRHSQAELLYVGSRGGMERDLVQRAGLAFRGLDVRGGVRGMGLAAVGNVLGLVRGFGEALALVGEFQPQAILATGGYVCAPVVVAGWLRGVPSLVYLPDLEPGWAIRFLAPFARRIAVSVPASVRFFRAGKTVVTGYPVRQELESASRGTARAHFGFAADDKVVLVAGGSRGAQRLNQAVAEGLEFLLATSHVIHVCGSGALADLEARRAALSAELRQRYRVHDYLHEMPLALAAADLVVCRAGASVLGELPAASLPAVLVPYAAGHRDQIQNAGYLAQNGAAIVIPDPQLDASILVSTVQSLLGDRARLAGMSEAARSLYRPRAAARMAHELLQIAEGR